MAVKTATLSEFAELHGWSPSYVTKLKQSGRLVLDGRRVKVKESLELIEHTAGRRPDIAQRHAQTRQSLTQQGVAETEDRHSLKQANLTKALAESRRVAALADKEEMERDRLAGDLIAREDVDAAMKFVGATLRGLLDVFPDQVAPLVAPLSGLDECHGLLGDQCRNVLVGLGDAIEKQRAALQKKAA